MGGEIGADLIVAGRASNLATASDREAPRRRGRRQLDEREDVDITAIPPGYEMAVDLKAGTTRTHRKRAAAESSASPGANRILRRRASRRVRSRQP